MRLHEARRDLYRRLAKAQGYNSRAAFKLLEAVEKFDFIHEGDRVVDFGASPGGWMQVVAELVGPEGLVVGVDLDKIRLKKSPSVVPLVGDVFDKGIADKILKLVGRRADVVLSDLAPTVSGVWELDHTKQADLTLRVLDLSAEILKPDGNVFCKLFEGERAQEVRDELKHRFRLVRPFKPAASRSVSAELYYFCEGLRAASATASSTSS